MQRKRVVGLHKSSFKKSLKQFSVRRPLTFFENIIYMHTLCTKPAAALSVINGLQNTFPVSFSPVSIIASTEKPPFQIFNQGDNRSMNRKYYLIQFYSINQSQQFVKNMALSLYISHHCKSFLSIETNTEN